MTTSEVAQILGIILGAASVVAVIVRADRRLTRVETTLTKNGGRNNPPTMLDKVHAIDKKLDVHIATSDLDHDLLADTVKRVDRIERTDP